MIRGRIETNDVGGGDFTMVATPDLPEGTEVVVIEASKVRANHGRVIDMEGWTTVAVGPEFAGKKVRVIVVEGE